MIATWMLSAMLFSGLLGIAAVCAESALRNARRQTRWAWLAALLAGAAWPLVAPLLRRYLEQPSVAGGAAVVIPGVRVVSDVLPAVPLAHWIDVALVALWGAATVVGLARLMYSLLIVRRIQRASEGRIVDDIAVLLTDSIGPAVVGVLKPRVLLPASLLDLDASLRRLVLRHEVEHCRARDQVAVIGSALVLALVPWNLPLWWIARRARLAIEMDCDARVLIGEVDARQYGQLLMLISQQSRMPVLAPMLVASSSHLERRVAAMLPITSRHRRTRIAGAFIGAVVLGIAACTSRISDVDSLPKPQAAVQVASADSVKPYVEFTITKPARQIEGTGPLHYPEELAGAYVEGVVRAQFVVREDGIVDIGTFKVLKSDHELFTKSVRSALPYMKFAPAETNGTPVRQLLTQTFTFAIDASEVLPPISGTGSPFSGAEKAVRAANSPAQQIPGTGMIRYPDELRAAHVEGEVIAQFVVTEEGRYLDGSFKVVKSTNPLFDEAVRKALPTMRFTAPVVNGVFKRQMIEQPFTFALSKQ